MVFFRFLLPRAQGRKSRSFSFSCLSRARFGPGTGLGTQNAPASSLAIRRPFVLLVCTCQWYGLRQHLLLFKVLLFLCAVVMVTRAAGRSAGCGPASWSYHLPCLLSEPRLRAVSDLATLPWTASTVSRPTRIEQAFCPFTWPSFSRGSVTGQVCPSCRRGRRRASLCFSAMLPLDAHTWKLQCEEEARCGRRHIPGQGARPLQSPEARATCCARGGGDGSTGISACFSLHQRMTR